MAAGNVRWGFHRLTEHAASRIVSDAGVRPGELVLDIGAGSGTLTTALVAAGARVLAFEIHPGRLAQLRERFADAPVQVVKADARTLRLPRRAFRVVANPPFGITVPLLRRLLAPGSRLVDADLVLPRGAVARWASPTAPGAQRWRRDFTVAEGWALPRRAFRPAAPMDCRVLVLRRRI